MKQRAIVFCTILAVVGGLVWWLFFKPLSLDAVKEELKEKAQSVAQGTTKADDLAALAVKAIDLKQGEHGVELWRLKAEWGNMRREGGLLELEKPNFTYYMPPHNEEVRVKAETGDVSQTSKLIRFRTNVQADYDGKIISGPLMVYNGTGKVLTFPEGAVFAGPGMSGDAPTVTWLLNEQLIKADGGVSMTWEGDRPLPGGKTSRKHSEAVVPPAVAKQTPTPAAGNSKAKTKPGNSAVKPGAKKAANAKKTPLKKNSPQKARGTQ